MREEHPDQQELPELPPGGPVIEAAKEISDFARLSAEVEPRGLIREHRPVFVFDKKAAQERSKNAERQARHREKKLVEAKKAGMVTTQIPLAISEKLTAAGGDWSKLFEPTAPASVGGGHPLTIPRVDEASIDLDKLIPVVQQVAPVPPAATLGGAEAPARRIRRLTPYGRRLVIIGLHIDALRGWRAWLVKCIAGI